MKTNQPLFWLAIAVVGLFLTEARGQETAIVKENHINVRGQASLLGEVITQLKKDETVVVLEEISVEKPKKDEPAKWARIQMPANTPVWVFASFIDPNNKTVTTARVNLRAGPGENFSVVGRLERGEAVKEIRKVDNWMEIETPDKAYAFVASEYLSKPKAKPAPVIAKSKKPLEHVDGAVNNATVERTPPAEIRKLDLPKTELPSTPGLDPTTANKTPPALDQTPAPATKDLIGNPSPASEPSLNATNLISKSSPPLLSTNAPVARPSTEKSTPAATASSDAATATPSESGPPSKRVVRREGLLRSTKSIQAPTYFELVSVDTHKPINYVHTIDPELKLKDFKGRKIILTGEEGIDARWPNTPILEVDTVEIAP